MRAMFLAHGLIQGSSAFRRREALNSVYICSVRPVHLSNLWPECTPGRHDFFKCRKGTRMRRLPPLNALQIFETVARHRSFTRAADHLCLTQGAVSRQILTLEEYYGFPLFTRHSKGLALTNEGEQLLPTVKESFSRIEEISLRLTRQRTDLALKVPTRLNSSHTVISYAVFCLKKKKKTK